MAVDKVKAQGTGGNKPKAESMGEKPVPETAKISTGSVEKLKSMYGGDQSSTGKKLENVGKHSSVTESSTSKPPDAATQSISQQSTDTSKSSDALPDAPWRKSPQQRRKELSETKSYPTTETSASTVGKSTHVVVTEESIVKTTSESLVKFAVENAATQLSSASSTVTTSAVTTSSKNLPPHVPANYKKTIGSPKSSPNLPRRFVQPNPPPAPPMKPEPTEVTSKRHDDDFSSESVVADNSTASHVVKSTESESQELQSTNTVEVQEQSPIVLTTSVVPVSDSENRSDAPSTLPSTISQDAESEGLSMPSKLQPETTDSLITSVSSVQTEQLESLVSPVKEEPFSCQSIMDSKSIPPPIPPPPANLSDFNESAPVSVVPFNILPKETPSEEYVPQSVTSRIKSFEKQSSMESDIPVNKPQQEIHPVGPWVKRTSAGPVEPQNIFASNLDMEIHAYEQPIVHAEVVQAVQPVKTPQQMTQRPHAYVPQAYQSPAQLERQRQQMLEQGHQFQPKVKHQPRVPHVVHAQMATTVAQVPSSALPPVDGFSPPSSVKVEKTVEPSMPSPSSALSQPPTSSPGEKDPFFDPWCDPENPRVVQFQDVSAAAFKIKSGIMNTPCTRSHMSSFTNMEIFFKKEFNQYTGSFKERGARYTLLTLSEQQRIAGVIAASAGNHALALSYHGQDLGIPVTVVMPLTAPIMKVQACRQYGANVIVRGNDLAECKSIALKMAKENGLLYINGYDHPHILAGQGTMGLEIVEQVPNIDAVVVPVGGGGLIAGVALAVKSLYPHIKVIGVESERCPSFSAALSHGGPIFTKAESSLADGLAVPMVGINAYATACTLIDKMVSVREEWIAIAILRLVEHEKAVVEGAGATGLAAILAGELPELKGKRVVIPLCGGNIDTTVLGRCLERGLAADGRLVKFTVTVSDRPGGIAELTRLMASLGVSIKDLVHERAWIKSDIFSVEVKVMCETRDFEHFMELKTALETRYKDLRFAMPDHIHDVTDF